MNRYQGIDSRTLATFYGLCVWVDEKEFTVAATSGPIVSADRHSFVGERTLIRLINHLDASRKHVSKMDHINFLANCVLDCQSIAPFTNVEVLVDVILRARQLLYDRNKRTIWKLARRYAENMDGETAPGACGPLVMPFETYVTKHVFDEDGNNTVENVVHFISACAKMTREQIYEFLGLIYPRYVS